jgi:hypothetical protein
MEYRDWAIWDRTESDTKCNQTARIGYDLRDVLVVRGVNKVSNPGKSPVSAAAAANKARFRNNDQVRVLLPSESLQEGAVRHLLNGPRRV